MEPGHDQSWQRTPFYQSQVIEEKHMSNIQQFDTSMQLLQKVLDLRSTNQQVVSSNIANAETPGYTAKKFEFEDQLKSAMGNPGLKPVVSHPGHIPLGVSNINNVQGSLSETRDQAGIGDENTVSVDQEMVKLSENQILYEAAVTMLNKKLSILKYAANGGA